MCSSDLRFENIPVGEEVKLIAMTIKNGKLYAFKREFKITENITYSMKTAEVSDQDFKDILN